MRGATTIGTGNGGNPLRPYLWGGAAGMLLLPAIAMRFFPQAGVDWSASDFILMGGMLATACGLYELGARVARNPAYRLAFGIAVLTAFLTVWVNLAVGMLGGEDDAINLLFAAVLLVAGGGALLGRFRASGMARAMAATAAAQLLATGIGLATGAYEVRELMLTAMFALPWLVSAAGFRTAARAA